MNEIAPETYRSLRNDNDIFCTRSLIADKMFDKYLYHYTSMDKGIHYIINSGKLRFSPLCEVNDPLESQMQFNSIHTGNNSSEMSPEKTPQTS